MKKYIESCSIKNTGINWKLDGFGKLTVAGSGKIPDCACSENPVAPWEDRKEEILELEIAEGITEIGINAFRGCEKLRKVILPDTLWRIHAYAFWDCIQLVNISSNRTDFKYVYDQREYKKDNTVIFGVGAFHNVPWCNCRWGDFYCDDTSLYVCFSRDTDIVLPANIRVLTPFSLAYLNVDSIRLSQNLEVIDDCAFSGSSVKKPLYLPDSVQVIENYAFINSLMAAICFPDSWADYKIREYEKILRKQKLPGYIDKYSLALIKDRRLGEFRRIKVIENKPICHKDGSVTKVNNNIVIDVGKSMYRKIRSGKVLLCITYTDDRVISVKSFAWCPGYELTEEYLMYPVLEDDGELLPWRDSFTYLEKSDIADAFASNGEELEKSGLLRYMLQSDIHEEWFWFKNAGDFGGPLEMELLELWLKQHPEITVDSIEDNRKHDQTRWFVDV